MNQTAESPLLAFTEKPLHLMSDDELRAKVSQWRARRANTPTLRSELQREAEELVETGRKKKSDEALNDLMGEIE
jgi:hypothetical protein